MTWQVYLSGEIHTDWRDQIEHGAVQAGLDVEFTGPVTDHAASDDAGVALSRFRVESSYGPIVPWDRVRNDLEAAFAGRLALRARLDDRARTYASKRQTASNPARTGVAFDNRASVRVNTQTPPRELLRRFYFDALTHDPDSLRLLIELVGADHIAIGTDNPFDMGYADPLAELDKVKGLTLHERDCICCNTARSLLCES